VNAADKAADLLGQLFQRDAVDPNDSTIVADMMRAHYYGVRMSFSLLAYHQPGLRPMSARLKEYSLQQPLGHRGIGPLVVSKAILTQPEEVRHEHLFDLHADDERLFAQLHECMHVRQLAKPKQEMLQVDTVLRERDADDGAALAFQIGCGGDRATVARRLLQRTVESSILLAGPTHIFWLGASPRELEHGCQIGGTAFLTGLYNAVGTKAPPAATLWQWGALHAQDRMLRPDPALGPEHAAMFERYMELCARPIPEAIRAMAGGLQQHIERPQQALPHTVETLIRKSVAAVKTLRPDWF
jgi:hypothetical protein